MEVLVTFFFNLKNRTPHVFLCGVGSLKKNLGSLKKCSAPDILAHLLQQIGQTPETTDQPRIHRCVHVTQSWNHGVEQYLWRGVVLQIPRPRTRDVEIGSYVNPSTDLLSFYNTKQKDRPQNKWWDKHISVWFICLVHTVRPQPNHTCATVAETTSIFLNTAHSECRISVYPILLVNLDRVGDGRQDRERSPVTDKT